MTSLRHHLNSRRNLLHMASFLHTPFLMPVGIGKTVHVHPSQLKTIHPIETNVSTEVRLKRLMLAKLVVLGREDTKNHSPDARTR